MTSTPTRGIPGHHAIDGSACFMFLASVDDSSPEHHGYDSRCGWCWLGATHSEAAHAAKVRGEVSAR